MATPRFQAILLRGVIHGGVQKVVAENEDGEILLQETPGAQVTMVNGAAAQGATEFNVDDGSGIAVGSHVHIAPVGRLRVVAKPAANRLRVPALQQGIADNAPVLGSLDQQVGDFVGMPVSSLPELVGKLTDENAVTSPFGGVVRSRTLPEPHWTEAWLGRPYTPAQDCAALVRDVLHDQYGQRRVDLPSDREWRHRNENALVRIARQFASPVVVPHDGDIVLMRVLGRRQTLGTHVGVYVVIGGRAHVLHAMERVGSVLQRESALWPRLEVTGYYRLK